MFLRWWNCHYRPSISYKATQKEHSPFVGKKKEVHHITQTTLRRSCRTQKGDECSFVKIILSYQPARGLRQGQGSNYLDQARTSSESSIHGRDNASSLVTAMSHFQSAQKWSLPLFFVTSTIELAQELKDGCINLHSSMSLTNLSPFCLSTNGVSLGC